MMSKVKWIAAIAASVATLSLAVCVNVFQRSMDTVIKENVEALSDDEYGLNIKQWTRTKITESGYNCYKPGDETC